MIERFSLVASLFEWLKHRDCDQYNVGSKPTCIILLCPWQRYFTAPSHTRVSSHAVLNCSHISTKLKNQIKTSIEQQYLDISRKQVGVIAYPMTLCLRCFPASQEDEYRGKIKKMTPISPKMP